MYQALKSSYHLLEGRAAQDETLQNSTSDCAHSPLSISTFSYKLQLSSWQDLKKSQPVFSLHRIVLFRRYLVVPKLMH